MVSVILQFVNLGILVVILVRVLKEPLLGFVKTRHETVAKDIEESAKLLAQAKAKLVECDTKMNNLSAELDLIRRETIEQGQEVQRQLIEKAKVLSVKIVEDAKAAGEVRALDAQQEIARGFVDSVMKQVEDMLTHRMTADDRNRFKQKISKTLETQA